MSDTPGWSTSLETGSDLTELLGEDVATRLGRAALRAHKRMIDMHLDFAMSGAMRWPAGMRPEVVIWTAVTVD